MTICIAACLFLLRTGSLSINRDVGSGTPTTGAAWPKILTHANAKSSPTARIFFMGAILRQPKSRCQVGWLISPPYHGPSPTQEGSAFCQSNCVNLRDVHWFRTPNSEHTEFCARRADSPQRTCSRLTVEVKLPLIGFDFQS